MKKSFLESIVICLVVCFLFSCNPMKKNVMTDIADDIKEVVISESGGEKFLISNEEIFQATSKSDKGGIRQITGYTENRISSYDLNTGKLSKRIALGETREFACIFLGETAGKLWYKSVNVKLGFHAREPKNLDVVITEEQVVAANPILANNLSKPEWNNVPRYYGFDIVSSKPMVTDNAGFVYVVDPVTLKAEKSSESIQNPDYDHSCTSTSIKLDAKQMIYLKGSPRCFIDYDNNEIKEPSFLKGEFLQSSNSVNIMLTNPSFVLPYQNEIAKYKRTIDSIRQFIAGVDTTSGNGRELEYKLRNVRYAHRNIENAGDRIKRIEEDIRDAGRDDFGLITDNNCGYVLSQTDVTDQAKVLITKIRFNDDKSVNQIWQTELKEIYRDPDKGLDKSSFEIVFSKGSPDLRTMRVVADDKKLIFIFMLKCVCIDIETGQQLWSVDL